MSKDDVVVDFFEDDDDENKDDNKKLTSNKAKLPATVSDLISQRKNPRSISLADRVEAIYLRMYERPEFKQYRDAIYKEDTVEGSFIDDDSQAANVIREEARKLNSPNSDPIVAKQKLSVLRRILGVVERRYNADRKTRQEYEEDDSGPHVSK
jgi:hypothetical protein